MKITSACSRHETLISFVALPHLITIISLLNVDYLDDHNDVNRLCWCARICMRTKFCISM